jgi:hypothetical protein
LSLATPRLSRYVVRQMSLRRCFTYSVLALIPLAACGDNTERPGDPDAPPSTQFDSEPPPIDAVACEAPTGYPEAVTVTSVDLGAPHTLTLDGVGSECQQMVRALSDPATRPPELDGLYGNDPNGSCFHDDVLDREIVRIRFPTYEGLTVFGPVQEILAHVDTTNTVVFLHADFLPVGHAPVAACLDGAAAAGELPGETVTYQRFAFCAPAGTGDYAIDATDDLEFLEEGVLLDADGFLRRVHAVDFYLAADHVTTEIGNSDAYCCDGKTLDHCVGYIMYVDALTGEVIAQAPHCHTC